MRVETQRFIDSFFGSLICRVLDVMHFLFHLLSVLIDNIKNINRIHKRDTDVVLKISDAGNICIILLSEMGSLTLTLPMMKFLKDKYPNSQIFILTFEKNIEIIKLLKIVDENNILTVNDSSFIRFTYNSLINLYFLRKNKINTIIDCELFARISSIYSLVSGAKIRVGFHSHTQEGLFRGNHINRRVLYNPYLHISHQFLNLAKAIESFNTPINKHLIEVNKNELNNHFDSVKYNVTLEDKNRLRDKISKLYPFLLERELVLINPSGGVLPIRAWSSEYYSILAGSLINAGYSIAITGLSEDKNIAQIIINSLIQDFYKVHNKQNNKENNKQDDKYEKKQQNKGGQNNEDERKDLFIQFCVDMTGFTKNLHEFLTLLSMSKLLITNDGGPGHFAALTLTPAVVLFGPETPLLYGCLNPNGVNLYSNCACSPCLTAYNHRNSPCDGNNLCLKSISPEKVLEKAFELLKKSKL